MSDWNNVDIFHFEGGIASSDARAIFKNSVRLFEIETFSYCNRVCWFCPNKDGSRRQENVRMDPELYTSIIDQLASIGYDKTVTYSRYNEPLYDRIILDRIREARAKLPDAKLHTNTNGDYVTHDYLCELEEAGLSSITIQVYLKNFEKYDHDKMQERASLLIEKTKLSFELVKDVRDEWIEYKASLKGLNVGLRARNFDVNGTNRGGTVDIASDYIRTSPCLQPFMAMYIDHDGSVLPCCNFRSDVPEHKSAVIRKIDKDSDIFEVYTSNKLAKWRTGLVGFDEKGGLCKNCRFAVLQETPESINLSNNISKILEVSH
ncbi:radical SAM/SPASM domain-containing protein [Ciceribacter sp. L1K23]|uniref:radical SAM/SPASM domain-containing protein n=1 Tax=Ciceribacter sp. L1K23 TaxID=2820276 RepID=UPI001B829231|nr:radical SAM/SPASM domain-containing protein [Ciceribacter sp. L1K23]MBR0554502.1 radical SAM/SPASM domain-containing protein [Ciceribacter sp. L1K23]